MIYYDYKSEGWRDEDNKNFFVDMTPEYKEDTEKEFENEDEFYRWYDNE